jgi:hypothetical protein
MVELFKFGFVFEFELSSLEKIKRKAFRKSLEKGKTTFSPTSPVQPVGSRAPAPPDRWAPPISDGFLPRTLSYPSLFPVGPVCRRQPPSPTRPRSLSASWARLVNATSRPPAHPTPSLCTVGPSCQLCLPRELPWTSAHARQEPRPRRLPTRPNSLLSTAHTRSLSTASFHASPPSLALCPRRSCSLEFRARRAVRLACQKLRQASPSAILR